MEAFLFTLPSKSRLGYNLIAMAATGQLKIYEPLDKEQQRDRDRLLRELETARYERRGTELMSFAVRPRRAATTT
jgi:hypothetical protein